MSWRRKHGKVSSILVSVLQQCFEFCVGDMLLGSNETVMSLIHSGGVKDFINL